MPGYVVHLAVASEIISQIHKRDENYINDFLLGNIIPDTMPRDQKKASHFWDAATYKNLNRIPNLNEFLNQYEPLLHQPFVLGYYAHLMLDNLFVKEYWGQRFTMLDDKGNEENGYDKVAYFRINSDGRTYPRDEFLSDELYYGDYDRMLPYILDSYAIKLPVVPQHMNIPIKEITYLNSIDMLCQMVSRVESIRSDKSRGIIDAEPLKVFELNHIYNLIDKVVSNVCELI